MSSSPRKCRRHLSQACAGRSPEEVVEYNQADRMQRMKRTILITGGSRGIGFGIARLALGRGMRVILLAQHEDALKSAARALVAEGFAAGDIEIEALDLAESDEIIRRVPTFPSLQSGLFGLVNNAAIEILKPFNDF